MRKFWGECRNDRYFVGCGGATVYIYDLNGKELGKFKDIPYAYRAVFKPGSNIIGVKSTGGQLAFYDLDTMTLLKKITVTRQGAQDEGFAFTPDGKYFYNIEKPLRSTESELGIYETENYTKVHTLFKGEENMKLDWVEFDKETGKCYFLGCFRHGEMSGVFVSKFDTEKLVMSRIFPRVSIEALRSVGAYKHWESYGFSQKKLEQFPSYANIAPVTIKEVFDTLAAGDGTQE